ncbi:cadherin-99C-like isoform X2 [Littorina saxatilis]|uniref:Cadherin domain-containing protein n=1 Tax=Littorina saxatilis TaxID=31220 RepID=A0AAN9GKF9_9CAEN
MNTVILLATFTVVALVQAQMPPCSSLDDGPFLGTAPTLTMDVYEATQDDLSSGQNDKYRAELRLHGEAGGTGGNGIVLEVMPNYQFMNPEDTFRFVANNSQNFVELYKPLDRDGPTAALDDDINVFSFTLKCSLQSNESDFRYYDAKIFVHDVNDNPPEFVTNMTAPLVINELTPSGMTVLEVKAEDRDISSNLSYSLSSPSGDKDLSNHFEIDPHTGHLRVTTPLDYETKTMGTLYIYAMDNGSPARTATATLNVMVEDGDDQGPVYVYEGCWTHDGHCAWPKYTTTTVLKKDQPISVMPVPNKVKAAVTIKAKDMDEAANPIQFSIASTIPPGSESMFRVTTASTGNGEYTATITPTQSKTVNHGFEIFLKATEQSEQGRFVISMIFFEETGHTCSTGGASAAGNVGTNDNMSPTAEPEKYTEPIVALIVVVSILAAFVLCLALAFFCFVHRSKSSSGSDINLTRM